MADEPLDLDSHRGMAAQKATDLRRALAEVESHASELRERRASASKPAPTANIRRPSSRARRPASSCAASISESCDRTPRLAAAHGEVLLSGLATALCAPNDRDRVARK